MGANKGPLTNWYLFRILWPLYALIAMLSHPHLQFLTADIDCLYVAWQMARIVKRVNVIHPHAITLVSDLLGLALRASIKETFLEDIIMKYISYISTLALTAFMGLTLACSSADAEDSIADRETWLSNASAMIASGELIDLEAKIKTTLGDGMETDVEELMAPLNDVMADHKPIYVDKIIHTEMGQTFDQHNGWQLYSLDFADNLSGLSVITN